MGEPDPGCIEHVWVTIEVRAHQLGTDLVQECDRCGGQRVTPLDAAFGV